MNRVRNALSGIVLLVALPYTGSAEPPPADVGTELAVYYKDGRKEPGWRDALANLKADDPAVRDRAVAYLRDLLTQAMTDEITGTAPWQPSPFWGSSGENPARQLRTRIADAVAAAPPAPGLVPVVRWFLEQERLSGLQLKVLESLVKIPGKEADELWAELVTRPTANWMIVEKALVQAAERKLDVSSERLTLLAGHYRPRIRTAARQALGRRGLPEPIPVEPTQALHAEAVRLLLGELDGLILDRAPADTPFVAIITTWTARDGQNKPLEYKATERGWLIGDNERGWELLTPNGLHVTYPAKDGSTKYKGWPANSRLIRVQIADEVARVAELRQRGDPEFQLSERGGLTAQFQGPAASLYEVVLAHWLLRNGQEALAARLLLPALDTYPEDLALVEMVRRRLGEVEGHAMLIAFVGDRDYDRTLHHAGRVLRHYPQTMFTEAATELTRQLPLRRDDFQQLRLPTPAEWARLKATLTRPQQIDYLCQRMRLLNCFQQGQPGGIGYADDQFAEPCGLSRDAAWGERHGQTSVINPYVELAGMDASDTTRPPRKRHRGLGLTVADLPQLAGYLREDWFFLGVSFGRDFQPRRDLHTTREIFAFTINQVACQTLCDTRNLSKMTDAQRESAIAEIVRFARDNEGKTEADLLLQAVEQSLKLPSPWNRSNQLVRRLVQLRDQRVRPLIQRLRESEGGPALPYVAQMLAELDKPPEETDTEEGDSPRQGGFLSRWVWVLSAGAVGLLVVGVYWRRVRAVPES